MRYLLPVLCAATMLTACVSMTPRAAKIMLHSQMSTQLISCEKLGPITASSNSWGDGTLPAAEQQAMNNLRDAVAQKYSTADSVVLINVDRTGISTFTASGIAFKCF